MTHAISAKLSREIASKVLDRAASLDATDERIDLATLRSAAVDAGISPDAFERALVESLATSHVRRPAAEPSRLNFYEASLKATIAGVIGGTAAITVVSVVFSDIGPMHLLPGAVVGGIGILTGALSYLKNKLKG
jgi:hypothetical protein